jgi:hypothetical protein
MKLPTSTEAVGREDLINPANARKDFGGESVRRLRKVIVLPDCTTST